MKIQTAIVCCLMGLGAALTFAQDAPDRTPREGRPGPGGPGPGPGGGPRFVMPLMQALDANGDGIIDETEIANASAALKKLDKNGDGKLTPDELRPPLPPPGEAGPGGPGRPGFRRPPGEQPGGDQGQRPQRPPPEQ